MTKRLLTACLTIATTLYAQSTLAQNFWGAYSGSSMLTAVDVNDDGISAYETSLNGSGRFGPSVIHTVSETTDVDGACGPTAVSLSYTTWSTIQRYIGGDLLYYALDETTPSSLCFDYVSGEFDFDIHAIITGGTGRFAGASGAIVLDGRGNQLLTDSFGNGVHSSVDGTFKGNISLNRK